VKERTATRGRLREDGYERTATRSAQKDLSYIDLPRYHPSNSTYSPTLMAIGTCLPPLVKNILKRPCS
jgi:hypothetical protein